MVAWEPQIMAVPVVPSEVQTDRPQVQALGPDSRALAVAELLQARVHPHAVYLFGSRARGDWGDDSDIDLMVLTPEKLPASVTGALASSLRPVAERLFGQPVGLQIFNYAQAEFNWARTSPNHLAGGVQRDGLNPEGKPMPPVQQNNPWPDVQQRLRAARRSLHDAFKSHGNDHDHVALSCAHNAIENALKAYASVCGIRYHKHHVLGDLVQQIQTRETGEAFPDREWMDKMSKFRVISPYLTEYPLPFAASEAVLVAQALCSRLASRVLHRSGKTPADVKYETLQYETEDLKRPPGGLGGC